MFDCNFIKKVTKKLLINRLINIKIGFVETLFLVDLC